MTPSPGIYKDIPFDEYRRWEAVNQSSLRPALRSMLHYNHSQLNPEPDDKPCFRFGRLTHAGKFEPIAVMARYVVMPDYAAELAGKYSRPRASNEYKELVRNFEATIGDREAVPAEWYDSLVGILAAIQDHERAKILLNSQGGESEVSFVWVDDATGLLCKGRADRWNPGEWIADLKTAEDAGGDFNRSIVKWGYDVQGAFYVDGLQTLGYGDLDYGLVAVEKAEPHGVRAGLMDEETLLGGRVKYRRALRQIAKSRRTGDWPGYDDPPEWHVSLPALTLTRGDEPLWRYA